VDINTASTEELMRIKHISTARAPDVVSSRPYTSLDQLTRVKGIAAGRLADIKAEGIACVG
jgi:DNA uptake protein ComE-like DNA-binding protein